MIVRILLAIMLVARAEALALQQQKPDSGSRTAEPGVETEPIACWWRTTTGAVRVGEVFSVVLTCSVLQTEAARTIVDESRLDSSVVALAPFEVAGGSRGDDLTTAGRRFFQYEYSLRAIAENLIGNDVLLPALSLNYRVESRAQSGTVQGRDLIYAMPPLPVRVLSMVPDNAPDIREPSVQSFREIDDMAFRGTAYRAIAGMLFVLGGLLIAVAAVRVVRRRRAVSPAKGRVLSDSVVLQAVRRELEDLRQRARESGWTDDLAARGLAALRIVAALASGKTVSQRRDPHSALRTPDRGTRNADRGSAVEGELPIGRVLVSAAVTANGHALREPLARLTELRYGRTATVDPSVLDSAIDEGIREAERLADHRPLLERLWPR